MAGGASLDAVVAAIRVLEDDPLFNAGHGSVLNHEGHVELDASIMDGATGRAGGVAGVRTVRNPIEAARAVMAHSPHVLLAGEGADRFAADRDQDRGFGRAQGGIAPGLEHGLAENVAAQVLAIASNYSHILFPATASGKNVAPRVAAKLDVAQISDITKVVSQDTFERPIYAGNAIVTVAAAADRKLIATVRNASFAATGNGDATAPIESSSVNAELPTHTRFVELQAGAKDRPDLQTASRVVSGGRALGSSEAFSVIYALADKLGLDRTHVKQIDGAFTAWPAGANILLRRTFGALAGPAQSQALGCSAMDRSRRPPGRPAGGGRGDGGGGGGA